MRFEQRVPPRLFYASCDGGDPTSDCGSIQLGESEQLTLIDPVDGTEHTDIARRSWGYYLTRSCNDRQREMGWRTAIIRNHVGRTYVVMVEDSRSSEFDQFLADTAHSVVLWVDQIHDAHAGDRSSGVST